MGDRGFTFEPIGLIRTPFTDPAGTPIQPCYAENVAGTVELRPEYAAGLVDLEGFSHLILLYQFHRQEGSRLTVVPFLDDASHGVFATRAPCRPNPIGLSIVRLVERTGCMLCVAGIDVVDRTPLLDVKPYVPRLDAYPNASAGWFDRVSPRSGRVHADARFGERNPMSGNTGPVAAQEPTEGTTHKPKASSSRRP